MGDISKVLEKKEKIKNLNLEMENYEEWMSRNFTFEHMSFNKLK